MTSVLLWKRFGNKLFPVMSTTFWVYPIPWGLFYFIFYEYLYKTLLGYFNLVGGGFIQFFGVCLISFVMNVSTKHHQGFFYLVGVGLSNTVGLFYFTRDEYLYKTLLGFNLVGVGLSNSVGFVLKRRLLLQGFVFFFICDEYLSKTLEVKRVVNNKHTVSGGRHSLTS